MDAGAGAYDDNGHPGPVLVIGGGGLGGIAWALGVLTGLGAACPRPDRWACVVGTSAGATVGAQFVANRLESAFAAQFEPSCELAVDVDLDAYIDRIGELIDGAETAQAARSRIGRLALGSSTPPADLRRAAVAERLRDVDWPDRDQLLVTAIDADIGELVVLRRSTGVDVVDAVTASCAVPGVWPVVELAGRRLMDGGMRSTCNADLGDAHGPRLVLVPSLLNERGRRRLERELSTTDAHVISIDSAALVAIGANPFDPECRAAAAEAGRRQGIAEREPVGSLLR
jgi:NTE family protein